tara:strand:- start:708 stop:815 length:108 start_codon:yes stop_codon:yes gene_type:complete
MSELKIIGWDVISFFIIDAINVLLRLAEQLAEFIG